MTTKDQRLYRLEQELVEVKKQLYFTSRVADLAAAIIRLSVSEIRAGLGTSETADILAGIADSLQYLGEDPKKGLSKEGES